MIKIVLDLIDRPMCAEIGDRVTISQNNGIINTSANTGASKILPATSVPKKKPISGGVTQTTIKQGSTTSQAPVPTNAPTTAQTTTTVPAPAPCVTTVSGKCV